MFRLKKDKINVSVPAHSFAKRDLMVIYVVRNKRKSDRHFSPL